MTGEFGPTYADKQIQEAVFVIRVRSVVKYALGHLGEKSIDFSSLSAMRFKRLL